MNIAGNSAGADPKSRLACVRCRRSKVKCEGGIPCIRCTRLEATDSCRLCAPNKRGRRRKDETAPTPTFFPSGGVPQGMGSFVLMPQGMGFPQMFGQGMQVPSNMQMQGMPPGMPYSFQSPFPNSFSPTFLSLPQLQLPPGSLPLNLLTPDMSMLHSSHHKKSSSLLAHQQQLQQQQLLHLQQQQQQQLRQQQQQYRSMQLSPSNKNSMSPSDSTTTIRSPESPTSAPAKPPAHSPPSTSNLLSLDALATLASAQTTRKARHPAPEPSVAEPPRKRHRPPTTPSVATSAAATNTTPTTSMQQHQQQQPTTPTSASVTPALTTKQATITQAHSRTLVTATYTAPASESTTAPARSSTAHTSSTLPSLLSLPIHTAGTFSAGHATGTGTFSAGSTAPSPPATPNSSSLSGGAGTAAAVAAALARTLAVPPHAPAPSPAHPPATAAAPALVPPPAPPSLPIFTDISPALKSDYLAFVRQKLPHDVRATNPLHEAVPLFSQLVGEFYATKSACEAELARFRVSRINQQQEFVNFIHFCCQFNSRYKAFLQSLNAPALNNMEAMVKWFSSELSMEIRQFMDLYSEQLSVSKPAALQQDALLALDLQVDLCKDLPFGVIIFSPEAYMAESASSSPDSTTSSRATLDTTVCSVLHSSPSQGAGNSLPACTPSENNSTVPHQRGSSSASFPSRSSAGGAGRVPSSSSSSDTSSPNEQNSELSRNTSVPSSPPSQSNSDANSDSSASEDSNKTLLSRVSTDCPRPDRFPWFNAHFATLLGYTVSELRTVLKNEHALTSVIASSDVTSVMNTAMQAATRHRDSCHYYSRWRCKSGQEIKLLSTQRIKYDSDGGALLHINFLQQLPSALSKHHRRRRNKRGPHSRAVLSSTALVSSTSPSLTDSLAIAVPTLRETTPPPLTFSVSADPCSLASSSFSSLASSSFSSQPGMAPSAMAVHVPPHGWVGPTPVPIPHSMRHHPFQSDTEPSLLAGAHSDIMPMDDSTLAAWY